MYLIVKQDARPYGLSGIGGLGCAVGCAGGCGHGLGAWDAQTAKNILAQANAQIAAAMPPPVLAAIDASPLNSAQKRWLKREPLSVLIILGDWGHDLMISFAQRVQAKSKKASSYSIGGRRVVVAPKKSDNPAKLMSQVLTVAFHNPVEAAVVLAEIHVEIASGIFRAGGAAVASAVSSAITSITQMPGAAQNAVNQAVQQAQQAAQQAVQQAQQVIQQGQQVVDQAVKAGQQAFDQGVSTVMSWFSGYGGLGSPDGGAVTVPAGATAGGVSLASVVALFEAVAAIVTALAPMIVPMLQDMGASKTPTPPTPAQRSETVAVGVPQAATLDKNVPSGVKNSAAQANAEAAKIFGLPPLAVYGGAAAMASALLLLAIRR